MVVTFRTSQPSFSMRTETITLYGLSQLSIPIGVLTQYFQFILGLLGVRFGYFTVVVRMDDEYGIFELGVCLFKVFRTSSQFFVSSVMIKSTAFLPSFHARIQPSAILQLRGRYSRRISQYNGSFSFPPASLCLAESGSTGCLTTFCHDSLYERIITYGLYENCPVIVFWRGCHVHL